MTEKKTKKRKRPKYPYVAGDVVKGTVTTGRGSTVDGPKKVKGTFIVLEYERDELAKRRVLVLRPVNLRSIKDKDVLYVGYTSVDKFDGKKVGEAWHALELPSHDVTVWAYDGMLYTYFDAVDAQAVYEVISESLEE